MWRLGLGLRSEGASRPECGDWAWGLGLRVLAQLECGDLPRFGPEAYVGFLASASSESWD